MPRNAIAFLALICCLAFCNRVALGAGPATMPSEQAEAKYTADIEKRVTGILDALKLEDAAKKEKVHDILIAQYRALRDWQAQHEAELKKKGITAEQKAEIIATRKPLHDSFLAKLAEQLTPVQIETVKDKLTYNKVQVTYRGYVEIVGNLTDAQKARIMEYLKEARELAIDGVSSEEKTDIFNKYKGRINNYLAKEGVDMKKSTADWNKRRAGATTNPSEK
jgi:hypothetical protein